MSESLTDTPLGKSDRWRYPISCQENLYPFRVRYFLVFSETSEPKNCRRRCRLSRRRPLRLRIETREPIEIIMACAAGRISIGDGRYWARTSDPQLVELVLSQLS